MSSNLYNKALKNIKFKSNIDKIRYNEKDMSDNLKGSFYLEFNAIIKSIEQKKLQRVSLFEFLSKYDGNIPEFFFYRNVMKLGDILMKFKYWTSANNECYERYLVSLFNICVEELFNDIENTVNKCLVGDDERLELTVSALFGICRAQFGEIECIDPLFESDSHRNRVQNLLRLYQKTMEMIIAKEKFCWLIYNGSVHIYEICKRLICCQRSIMAVEPLIWASCYLETSIPLLTLANLRWRATLYSAVCQALFNCGQDAEAERFARRGLVKINELNALYEMSSESLTVDNSMIITEATIKMAVMIFKRAAFEMRRRPKTYLRPKTKVNFKELLQGNWPRTGTERLLAEMFESPSQQALAIVEAIKQPSRPLCKIGLPAPENDWDILDVYAELFYAFTAIVTGRSSVLLKGGKGFVPEFRVLGYVSNEVQLGLSVKSGTEVTPTVVFDMVCWAFTYANWEFMDVTIEPLIALLKESQSNKAVAAMLSTLQLLMFMRRAVLSSKIDKKTVKMLDTVNEEEKAKDGEVVEHARSNLGTMSSMSKDTKSSKSKRDYSTEDSAEKQKADSKGSQDPLYQLAEFVNSTIASDNFDVSLFSMEVLIESGVILWSKCKSVFHSVQDGSLHSNTVQNISSSGKWLYILTVVHRLFTVTNYCLLNPVAYAEISLRLALLLESVSSQDYYVSDKEEQETLSLNEFIDSLHTGPYSRVKKCLLTAKKTLETSLQELDNCRGRYTMNKGIRESDSDEIVFRNNSLDDVYLELHSVYFRVSVKSLIIHICARKEDKLTLTDFKNMDIYKDCLLFCNKNSILKSLFYATAARQLAEFLSPEDVNGLAKLVRSVLGKADENVSVTKVTRANNENPNKLPPPIVVERGCDYISIKLDVDNIPAELKNKIGWIRLYGRAVDTPNAEVRLTDDKLVGTGVETCSLQTVFSIRNLRVNEQYIMAFAAFDKSGAMIGRGMGHSTKKILATDSMSVVTASTIIAQMFYEIGLKDEVIRYESDLWNHFIECPTPSTSLYSSSSKPPSYCHQNLKMKKHLLETSSAMLLRQFCLLVMSSVECKAELNGVLAEPTVITTSHVKEQILRIHLCDKLLAMFTISKKLKNHILSMELFANVVNLTIPIINHNQFYEPFVQILLFAMTTLHSNDCIPQTTWIKIPQSFKANLHHMIASVGFYLLKYFYKYDSSSEHLESVRNSTSILLQMSSDVPFTISEQEEAVNHSNVTSRQDQTTNHKQIVPGKKVYGKQNKSDGVTISNLSPQQISFEAYKYAMITFGTIEHTLTGTDEPDILLAYIANLPSKAAYKEVIKFSRKTRYLQFAVEVVHKAMVEGNLEQSIAMYKDVREWLRKRNETILGRSVLPAPSQMNVDTNKKNDIQDLLSLKQQSSREDEDMDATKKHYKKTKKTKYQSITVTSAMNEAQKKQQEELELKACAVLTANFVPICKRAFRRRKFRQVSEFELSSRIKLNSSIAMSYLGIAQTKLDALIQMLSAGYNLSDLSETEDVTRFMLNETGQILPLSNLRVTEAYSALLKITKPQNDPSNDRPRTFRPEMKFQEKRMIAEAPKLLSQYVDNVNKSALLFKKAIVLSDRGHNWLLLSRSCGLVLYAMSIVTNMSVKFEYFINKATKEYPVIDWNPIKPISSKDVFQIFIESFYLGSDSLMSLMEYLEEQKEMKCFDRNFMETFILRTLHILYETKKFEKLIHITLRFTKLTRYTFVNVTHPLVVQCQEGLVQMAKDRAGQDPNWSVDRSKEHISRALSDLNWDHIDSSNYGDFIKIREKGTIGRVIMSRHKQNIEGQTNNIGAEAPHVKTLMTFLTSKNNVPILFSVPVDVEFVINEWKQKSVDKNVRRLWIEMCHKRQLYLYQRNMECSAESSTISFNYIKRSYKELIEVFKSDNEKEHRGLLQRDLGDLFANKGDNYGRAIALWKESLENLLNESSPLEHLDTLLINSAGKITDTIYDTEKLSSKYGILKCFEIAGVLSRIIRHENFPMDKRTMLCLCTALFYKAVYGTSLCNSNCDLDYLDQTNSLDAANPVPLLIKLHITSDQSRNDIQDVESQLWFLIEELLQAGYLQQTLPLMALYEHIVNTYFRNSLRCVQIRILKCDVAIQSKQFNVASRLLFQLLTGNRLPQQLDSQMGQSVSKTIADVYDDRKHILDDNNVTVLDRIMSRRLNPNVSQKIGLTLANRISILQATFLLEIASSIYGNKQSIEPKASVNIDKRSMGKKSIIKKSETISDQSEEVESILEQVSSKMQWESSKQITLPQLKGLLLQVSSGLIQPMISDLLGSIQKENPRMWKGDQSTTCNVILALLVQAKICRKLFHNRSGARLAMFACKVLEEVDGDSTAMESGLCREQRRLNVRLHLQCNKEIVKCLLGEIGIGQIIDFTKTAITDVPDLKALILSSISECDENCMAQSKAWFISALARLTLSSGYEVDKYSAILKESVSVLNGEMILSEESKYLYCECKLQEINLSLSLDQCVSLDGLQTQVISLQEDVLASLDKRYPHSIYWNVTDPGLSLPHVFNKYDALYDQVARLKLLLATILMHRSVYTSKTLSILNSGLVIIRVISSRKPWIEVEMLMLIGRLQRYLMTSNRITATSAAISSLVEGLKLSMASSGHLGIQKQFFLEMALTFMQSSRLCEASFNDKGEMVSGGDLLTKTARTKTKTKDISAESLQYSKLAWLAMKCASDVASCMRQRCNIKSDSSRLLDPGTVEKMPLALCYDIYGRYLLGDKRVIFKNEIEEELSRMPEARVPRDSEQLEDQLEWIRKSSPLLNWSQLLSYQESAIKITNNQYLTTTEDNSSFLAALTRRLSGFSEIFSKEFEVHKFMKSELSEYSAKCVPFVPKDILLFSNLYTQEGVEDVEIRDLNKDQLNVSSGHMDNSDISEVMKLKYGYYQDVLDEGEMKEKDSFERMDLNECDLSIHVYNPPFEHSLHLQKKVMLLYSCCKKIPKSANKFDGFLTGFRLVPTDELMQVFEILQETAQHLDILSNNSEAPPQPSTKSVEPSKKVTTNASTKTTKMVNQQMNLGPGSEISTIELKLRTAFDSMASWMNEPPAQRFAPPAEMLTQVSMNSFSIGDNSITLNNIPFELNVDNIRTLANFFNPIQSKHIINNPIIAKFILDFFNIDFL